MKVKIIIDNEGENEDSTLECRMVNHFCEQMKENFEKNGVPTEIESLNKKPFPKEELT